MLNGKNVYNLGQSTQQGYHLELKKIKSSDKQILKDFINTKPSHKKCYIRDTDLIPGLGRSPEVGTATHSNILAWRIPWTEEVGGLQSMGLQSQTRLKRLIIESFPLRHRVRTYPEENQ